MTEVTIHASDLELAQIGLQAVVLALLAYLCRSHWILRRLIRSEAHQRLQGAPGAPPPAPPLSTVPEGARRAPGGSQRVVRGDIDEIDTLRMPEWRMMALPRLEPTPPKRPHFDPWEITR